MTANQIIAIAQAAASEAVNSNALGKTITTSNATETTVETITPADNSAGVITVIGVGMDSLGQATAGELKARYVKYGGSVTLGTPAYPLPIEGPATFGVSESGGDILVTVTGIAATEINWKVRTEIDSVNGVETAL